ncbi:(deoxy)nucleoside triphosphate pyrophosphohydrolase [Blastococcus sp. VKM Ac-2987]|uniref:(deoxy)nucleoside triphosphate pyrophosphohydrolase n=1 Tax=Blastococcus sp. VKM Ac-2987 TaxID=3004141 RepID=UPI0022AB816B|nr:(deoxy)nucleoside triphosphate pyrophosphohydrolase [Blastococcus sp. VKM Ac-2987]MCZ2857948.1 (deoxy)nucleoside triphosphate pyrophosphohydrolase [Blastococcus sp. VKM Ac-2987]
MFQLRFTTMVEAPLTVAFDVARALGRPWPVPLEEVVSVRPERDVYAVARGRGWVTHSRRFSATGAGTLVDEQVDWETGLPGAFGGVVDQMVLRGRIVRAMRSHLDAYAAAAALRAHEVVQVVGAALVDGDRVLVAQRSGGRFDGCWEFPGGKVEPGEPELAALVRECAEELGVVVAPQAFLGEVPLDGVVAGGAPGASTMRVWWARIASGRPVAHEHADLRWVGAGELESLDWIPADRPLLPAVRALLARL